MAGSLREALIRPTFLVPGVLGLTSLSGLILALLDDGPLDWIAWGLLSLPVLALIWSWRRRHGRRRHREAVLRGD